MDDMHEYCNVAHALPLLDPSHVRFMRGLREFRAANPWLRGDFGPEDHFDYLKPVAGRTIFVALRHAPEGRRVFAITHMEGGETEDFDAMRLPVPGLGGTGWRLVLRTPPIGDDYLGGPLVLRDSMGLVFVGDPS
jgi:hypothetical protein